MSEIYIQLLAFHSGHRGLLPIGVLLLQDNARLHSVAPTLEAITKLKLEILLHPRHSLDLALSDYHMLGPQKKPCVAEGLPVLRK
jgi:hypothetical protein